MVDYFDPAHVLTTDSNIIIPDASSYDPPQITYEQDKVYDVLFTSRIQSSEGLADGIFASSPAVTTDYVFEGTTYKGGVSGLQAELINYTKNSGIYPDKFDYSTQYTNLMEMHINRDLISQADNYGDVNISLTPYAANNQSAMCYVVNGDTGEKLSERVGSYRYPYFTNVVFAKDEVPSKLYFLMDRPADQITGGYAHTNQVIYNWDKTQYIFIQMACDDYTNQIQVDTSEHPYGMGECIGSYKVTRDGQVYDLQDYTEAV